MNNLILKMCLAFCKIGAFCFGGGYASLALIQNEIIEANKWLSMEQYVNIVAIAEMTPGPIAVNTATFAGYLMSGVPAGILCTLSLILIPSALSLLTAFFAEKVKDNETFKTALKGIRPAALGIIAAAALSIGKTGITSWCSLIFFSVAAWIIFKMKKSPIIALLVSGVLGVAFYSFFPALAV